jgi:hypothetical protein
MRQRNEDEELTKPRDILLDFLKGKPMIGARRPEVVLVSLIETFIAGLFSKRTAKRAMRIVGFRK